MWSAHDKHSALKRIEQAWEEVNKIPCVTECRDCQYCHINYCNHWKSAIPDDVMKKGCEAWKFDPLSPPF